MRKPALRGLYAITPISLCADPQALLVDVGKVLEGGAKILQYRDKTVDAERRRQNVGTLLALCRQRGALLIVNDDVALAAETGADGVHLGTDDLPLTIARARLGPSAIIGITCANSLLRVQAASDGGADYVALGAFYPSRTKPDAKHASLELLKAARALTRLPICAIGGITAERAGQIICAGADMIAAVDGVFAAPDIEQAARDYARQF